MKFSWYNAWIIALSILINLAIQASIGFIPSLIITIIFLTAFLDVDIE